MSGIVRNKRLASDNAASLMGQPRWHPAIENLRTSQRQLDADGVMVGVSRQALDETLAITEQVLEALRAVMGSHGEQLHDAFDDAHKAIAKAEGRE